MNFAVAYRAADITDKHLDRLKQAGWTKAEIYEVTVAGPAEAVLSRLETAWVALRGEGFCG